MKRGLKASYHLRLSYLFSPQLNEKRIERNLSKKDCTVQNQISQWKEDWKWIWWGFMAIRVPTVSMKRGLKASMAHSLRMLNDLEPQWKEDWKTANAIMTPRAMPLPVSMKRGLKVLPLFVFTLTTGHPLNEKRIESLLNLLSLNKPHPVAQWKEDWKSELAGRADLNRIPPLNEKRIESLLLPLRWDLSWVSLNEKRIESQLTYRMQFHPYLAQWKEDWKADSDGYGSRPGSMLNEKRIESRLPKRNFPRSQDTTQWKEDWKTICVSYPSNRTRVRSMKRGLKGI